MSKFEQYLVEHCDSCKEKLAAKKKRMEEYEKKYEEEQADADGNKKYTRRELADKFGVPESDIRTNAVKGRTDLWIFYKNGKPQTYKKA